MELNTWWIDQPEQRYWMEITDRGDLGGPLIAPKLPGLTWGYDLVSQVQPGDRILHWSTNGNPSRLVGWSEVVEHAAVVPEYTWTPRHGLRRTTKGWWAVLGGLHTFSQPVLSSQLLPLLEEIVSVDDALTATHKGTVYFPFTRYGANRPRDRQELRAAQAYFVKFPVELFDVIPGIQAARIEDPRDDVDIDIPEDYQPPGAKAPAGRTTRAQDPKLRDAVERHSLDVAKSYYTEELQGTDYQEVGRPYDIRVTVDGVDRRCEVKGSSIEIGTVELTINEVEHGTEYRPVDLIVVDKIELIRDSESGDVIGATGGRRRVWPDWTPSDTHLKPTRFAYTLPPAVD